MNNFQAWYNDADMPEKTTHGWVDMETGIAFDPSVNYLRKGYSSRSSVSKKALSSRNVAKLFGGKALIGTAKQKEWAEKIRAEKLQEMTEEQATLACAPSGLGKAAKFWIENRGKKGAEIGGFFQTAKELREKFAQLEKGTEECRAVAEKYNSLTAAWGFE